MGSRGASLLVLKWSTGNAIGFALGGAFASLVFPLMFAGALGLGAITAGLLLILPWDNPGIFAATIFILPAALVGGATGYLVTGIAGIAQEMVLLPKVSVADKWARRSVRGGLLGGAIAGVLVLLLSGIATLVPFTEAPFPPIDSNVLPGTGTGTFFPINWLFRRSLNSLLLLLLAGTITGLFVGRRQQRSINRASNRTPVWPYWSAVGWGLGWATAAVLSEPLLKSMGVAEAASREMSYRAFENWPVQLAASALSLAICGAVYGLITFRTLLTLWEEMLEEKTE